ncbi:hypothetical protein FOL47_010051 [Perkinsus chesapeaki]|uniref:Uncharacterized protein n=1 Tax=Perkinsus chesapeaki TaxID=330153 RepID=A0A7J6L500_PERCH|nr:hypothetical protein FOL47_010051 [Perkinsus chesapeaki]
MRKSFIVLNLILTFCGGLNTGKWKTSKPELRGTYKGVLISGEEKLCPTLPKLDDFTLVVESDANGMKGTLKSTVNGKPLKMKGYENVEWYKDRVIRVPGKPRCARFVYSVKKARSPATAYLKELFAELGLGNVKRPSKELAICFQDGKWFANILPTRAEAGYVNGFKHTFELKKDPSNDPQGSINKPSSTHSLMEEPPKKRARRESGNVGKKYENSNMATGRSETPPVVEKYEDSMSSHPSGDITNNVYPGRSDDDDTESVGEPVRQVQVDEIKKTALDDSFHLSNIVFTNTGLNGNKPVEEEEQHNIIGAPDELETTETFNKLGRCDTINEKDLQDLHFDKSVVYPTIVDKILREGNE